MRAAAFLPFLAVLSARPPPDPAPRGRIAIIGAGIGGASTAWFLRDEPLDVTVFEADRRVGGRVRETRFPQQEPITVEAGGAAIHSLNQYMAHFIDALGLHRDDGQSSGRVAAGRDGQGAASWDGDRLTRLSPWAYPLSILRARRMVSNVTSMWERIYELQAKNVSFADPREMLVRLGVAELAATSAAEWMQGRVDAAFLREFVDGVSRVNYGQGSSINAFAEAVSLAGAGLVGSLFSVREGNSKVMEGLLRASGAELRYGRVSAVRAAGPEGYSVCVHGGACETFASVVIAAPLELAGLALDEPLRPRAPPREYQVTVATFVAASRLNATYFGAAGVEDLDTITTTSNASIPFNSVAVHGASGGRKVYKVFSRETLSAGLIRDIFANASAETQQFVWHAYPVLRPSSPWPAFRLHRGAHGGGLYYVNAMESSVSCMETEAVAAKNVALLLRGDLPGRAAHGDPEPRVVYA